MDLRKLGKFEANFLLLHINKQHNTYGIARGVLEITLACRVSPCTWGAAVPRGNSDRGYFS